jgi:hypothetical protein
MRFSTLLVVLALLGGTVLVAKRAVAERDDAVRNQPGVRNPLATYGLVAGSDTAPQTAPLIAQAIGTARVKDESGALVPVVPPGTPTIIMISSRTCSWCKRTLKDLGKMSAGRPVPRLTVLTLEGAGEGAPMLAKEKLTGARLVGPASSAEEVLLTFRYPGTPTLIAVDRNGRVVRTIPGYPIGEELRHLWTVMVGDNTAP